MRAVADFEPRFASLPAIEAVRSRVDGEIRAFLDREREDIRAMHPGGGAILDELVRLVGAGGKRIRPAFCYWGYRAAGGRDDGRDGGRDHERVGERAGGRDGEPIVRAAAALELLHTFALIHDDVMDRSELRRGIASTHARVAAEHRSREHGDAEHLGLSVAILAGDLAGVLADRLFLSSGFAAERLLAARSRYDEMRVRMAVGQFLDLTEGGAVDAATAQRISSLKTGSYTVEGPLLVGAALAGGPPEAIETLSLYGAPLGEAFQVRDDLVDLGEQQHGSPEGGPTLLHAMAWTLLPAEERDRLAAADPVEAVRLIRDSGAPAAAAAHLDALVAEAETVLEEAPAPLARDAVGALRSLARAIRVSGDDVPHEGAVSPW